jgi:oligoribonuclease
MTKATHIVWLDLETGGLRPDVNGILECAAILTDGDLKEVSRFHRLIRSGLSMTIDDFVRDMHTKSGLLDDLGCKPTVTHEELDADLFAWMESLGCIKRKTQLGGSSVHFDFRFLGQYARESYEMFSHRLVDVSAYRTVKNILIDRDMEVGFPSKSDAPHRAIKDIEHSLAGARSIQTRLAMVDALKAKSASMVAAYDVIWRQTQEGAPPGISEDLKALLALLG